MIDPYFNFGADLLIRFAKTRIAIDFTLAKNKICFYPHSVFSNLI